MKEAIVNPEAVKDLAYKTSVLTGLTDGIKTIALNSTYCPDNSVRWINTATTNTSELPNGNSRYGLACIKRRNSTSISITLYPENGNEYIAAYDGSSWTNWVSPYDQIGTLNSNMARYTKADGTLTQYQNQDLDTLTTSGRYYIHSNCPNRPTSNGGYLEVLSYNSDWFKQVYYSDNNNGTYIRTKRGSNTWDSWERIANKITDNIQGNSSKSIDLTNKIPCLVAVGRNSTSATGRLALIDAWGGIVNLVTHSQYTLSTSGNVLTIANDGNSYASIIITY